MGHGTEEWSDVQHNAVIDRCGGGAPKHVYYVTHVPLSLSCFSCRSSRHRNDPRQRVSVEPCQRPISVQLNCTTSFTR